MSKPSNQEEKIQQQHQRKQSRSDNVYVDKFVADVLEQIVVVNFEKTKDKSHPSNKPKKYGEITTLMSTLISGWSSGKTKEESGSVIKNEDSVVAFAKAIIDLGIIVNKNKTFGGTEVKLDVRKCTKESLEKALNSCLVKTEEKDDNTQDTSDTPNSSANNANADQLDSSSTQKRQGSSKS